MAIQKNTKIVCTIGPASETLDVLKKLIDNGMNVARLNFSHGTYDEHFAKIEKIRSFQKDGIYIPIMLDTKGPEIRCHDMENGSILIKKDFPINLFSKKRVKW